MKPFRLGPSDEELEAAALAGMSEVERAEAKALAAVKRKRRRRSKRGPEEDRMVKGPVEDQGRKRGRRG